MIDDDEMDDGDDDTGGWGTAEDVAAVLRHVKGVPWSRDSWDTLTEPGFGVAAAKRRPPR